MEYRAVIPVNGVFYVGVGGGNTNDVYTVGGGAGGERLPPPVPPLLPPVPFCELSSASRLFSTNLAMLLLLSRPI